MASDLDMPRRLIALLLLTLAACAEGRPAREAEHKKRPANPRPHEFQVGTQVKLRPLPSAVTPGFDSERLWSAENDWEPAVAAAPDATIVYQMTTRYGPSGLPEGPDPLIVFRRSTDAGASWEPDQFPNLDPGTQNDPQLAAAVDGLVYAAWLQVWDVVVARSTDYGVTWSGPVDVLKPGGVPTWSDKPVLTASPDGRDVYVAFNASDSFVVASHDFGQTFADPVPTSNDNRYWFHTGGAVSPGGAVYFAATDYSQNYQGPVSIHVLHSSDGGASWTTSSLDVSSQLPSCSWSPGCPFGFMGPSMCLAVDPAGLVLAAYNAGESAGAPQRLYVRTSPDGSVWSARTDVGAVPAGVNHAFPAVAAGGAPGDFRLVWQDDRKGMGLWNTWYRQSTDGGGNWSLPRRLSDLPSGASYKAAQGYAFPYGDYVGLAVDPAGASHVVWGEGAVFIGPGGSWYTRGDVR